MTPNMRLALAVATTLLAASQVWGNVGPPAWGGQAAAEPTGLEAVEVTREVLLIDLRPVAEGGRVVVEARYELNNRGAGRTLGLAFVTASEAVADFEVRLGGDRLPADVPGREYTAVEYKDLPEAWRPPATTPGLHGEDGVAYLVHGRRRVVVVPFTLPLPPGPHTLTVRYRAEAARNHRGPVTDYWQFAYSLAPARAWAGFGGLDVTVRLPGGWAAASDPALAREGDELRGRFPTLPTDALAITTQAPVGPGYDRARWAAYVLVGLTLAGGLWLCWWVGRRRGRAGRPGWLAGAVVGWVWAVALVFAGIVAVVGPGSTLPPGQKNPQEYAGAYALIGVVLLSALALPGGCLVTGITAAVVRRLWARG